MPLRTADTKAIRKFEDGDDWLELRVGGLTKGESDRLRDLTAAYRIDPGVLTGANPEQAATIEIDQRTAQANRLLFDLLAIGWSLELAVSGDSYAGLDEESGQWVDECLAKVLAERRERAEKNARSSKKAPRRARSSAEAAS